jgi:phosphate transport system protein
MSMHLHRAIEALKVKILELSASVESCVYKAVKAVEERDGTLAQEVINSDSAIDLAEVEVEEECLKILALHQPVATDLRFIVAVLKINNDLERIGDLAVNIASRASALSKITTPPLAHIDFQDVQTKVQRMLRRSLEALVNLDESMARSVCASDDVVDEINRSVHKQVLQNIREHPTDADRFLLLLSVSRNLERIGDHATNIAEDVVYMIRGEIVRHTQVA